MLQHAQGELKQSEDDLDQVWASTPPPTLTQLLVAIHWIEDLRQSKKIVCKKLKPWFDAPLQLAHDAQSAIARLHQLLERVGSDLDGHASLTRINIVQHIMAQSKELLPPLLRTLATLCAQIEGAPPK